MMSTRRGGARHKQPVEQWRSDVGHAPDQQLAIRLAGPEDVHEVMRLSLMACEDNGFLDCSPELLLKEVYPALCQHHGLFAVIGPPGGEIQGFVMLRVGTLFYSNRPCLEEKCLWVHPDHRSARGGRARQLLEFTKKTADELGLPLIIGIMSTKRSAGKVRLYEKMFGEPAGAFFLYGAECGKAREMEEEVEQMMAEGETRRKALTKATEE
jgi:GNAT superfamily N-acetyltransferase